MSHASPPESQRGYALLLIPGILTVIAVLLLNLLQQSGDMVSRTSRLINTKQAYYFARGAETLAHHTLGTLWREESRVALYQYLQSPYQFSLDGPGGSQGAADPHGPDGSGQNLLRYRLDDMQGRFNLNNLFLGTENELRDLRSLLSKTGIPPSELNALRDWMDSDETPSPGGRESRHYAQKNTPYLAANQPLASSAELALFLQAEASALARLMRWVTVQPGYAGLNPITMDEALAHLLLRETEAKEAWYKIRQAFAQSQENPDIPGYFENSERWTVDSSAIRLSAEVTHSNTRLQLTALFTQVENSDGTKRILTVRRSY